ncbi:hypothetical protein SAY87_031129 [Trapa incisa]|uniref:Beta-Casp domain-containing protein n=1 Tax=Trapa incisa TaxID=236973 RepID=A0AAN7QKH2_9MYRT|nr:hypothetical protein SAY87_031129 [Trapa incisa]
MEEICYNAHALEFDCHPLQGNDVILYTDSLFPNTFEHSNADRSSIAAENPPCLSETSEEREKLDFICSCVIASVKSGGSALIPIDQLRILLALLEMLLFQLENSDIKVPVYVVSSVAEEMLAFTNIIPEWLCKPRQEQLFSGASLFAHVELIKEGKIQVYPDIHSPKLLSNWQEPCIVFCPHWNLRLGPVVNLLWRWHEDEKSLLVLEEGIHSSLSLLPFSKTIKMKVIQCSFLSGIELNKIQPFLDSLQPKLVLLPESIKPQMTSPSIIHYSVNETIRVPSSEDGNEIDIAPDLISHLQWRSLNEENLSITRLNGKLAMLNGRSQILAKDELPLPKGRPLFHWGSPDLQKLLSCLLEMGVCGSILENNRNRGTETAIIIQILEPKDALIEVSKTGTTIIAADKKLASLIFEAVSCTVDGV